MENRKVTQDEADEWLVRCVVGNIFKDDLDNERTNEINSLDLMQNASVITHTESVMEMQIMCLLFLYALNQFWEDQKYGQYKEPNPKSHSKLFGDISHEQTSKILIWIYLGEHIMSYIFGAYRKFEIQHLGEPDDRGIERAPVEKKLSIIELIVDCVIFGGSIYHLTTKTSGQLHD